MDTQEDRQDETKTKKVVSLSPCGPKGEKIHVWSGYVEWKVDRQINLNLDVQNKQLWKFNEGQYRQKYPDTQAYIYSFLQNFSLISLDHIQMLSFIEPRLESRNFLMMMMMLLMKTTGRKIFITIVLRPLKYFMTGNSVSSNMTLKEHRHRLWVRCFLCIIRYKLRIHSLTANNGLDYILRTRILQFQRISCTECCISICNFLMLYKVRATQCLVGSISQRSLVNRNPSHLRVECGSLSLLAGRIKYSYILFTLPSCTVQMYPDLHYASKYSILKTM